MSTNTLTQAPTSAMPDTLTALAYDRLSAALSAVHVPLYVGTAPEPVEGSGRVYVVLKTAQDWLPRSRYSDAVGRVLLVQIFADVSRWYEQTNPAIPAQSRIVRDAESRALGVLEVVDPLLDRTSWPGVIVAERVGVQVLDVPDSEAVLMVAKYDVRTWGY